MWIISIISHLLLLCVFVNHLLSNPEYVRPRESLVSEPLARFIICIGIIGHHIEHFDIHFLYANARYRVIGNVEFARKWTQLLVLQLVNAYALLVG